MKRKKFLHRASVLTGLISVFLLLGIIGIHADMLIVDEKKFFDENNTPNTLEYGEIHCTVKGFKLGGWVAYNEQPNCIRMDIYSQGATNQNIGAGYWTTQSNSGTWNTNPSDKDILKEAAGDNYKYVARFSFTFELDDWYEESNFILNHYFTIRIRYFSNSNKECHDFLWKDNNNGITRPNLDVAFQRYNAHTVTGTPYTSTYTGAAISYPASSVTAESNGAKSYTYYDAEKNELACMPVSAGTYYVKVTMAETNKYTEKTSDYIPITVTKATRTISLSKGADRGTPHVLTYPSADTFVVTATGTEEPGMVTALDTAYASFQTDTQTVTYTENFDNVANGSLPSGYRVIVEEQPPATAGVSSGGLELRSMGRDVARYLVRLPVENLLASDFVFEADVTFLAVIDDRRWVSLAYSLQDERYLTYMQMAVRQGTTAQDGVEYAHWTGADYWTVRKTAPYSLAFDIGTTHHLKVEGSKGYIREYVDGKLMLELTDIYYEAGGFGLSVAGCHARFDNISISGSAAERTTITTTPTASTDGVQSTTVTMAETQNYNAATATYYYQIDKGTMNYTAEDYTGVYDGAPHGITVTVQSPDGTTVKYGTSSDNVTSDSHLLYTNVGDYTEYFTIEKPHYHPVAASRTVTINKAVLTVYVDSDLVNTAQEALMKEKTTQAGAAENITLPASYTIENANGSYGSISDETYTRSGVYYNALGVIDDTVVSELVIETIPCVTVTYHITTGQNAVYGNNITENGEQTTITTYVNNSADSWQIVDKARKIATNAPATATINVYLKEGEHLLIDTAIGVYYGRMDVTVTNVNESTPLAEDKIDAFFPANHEDDFRVSKLQLATNTSYNANRGDYWSDVVPFTAPKTGVYTFTITVTGESYLHSIDDRYTQNLPAQKPVIELLKFTINGTEQYGIDA